MAQQNVWQPQESPTMKRGADESPPLRILLLGPGGAGKSAVAVQVLCKWGGLEPRTMELLQRQMEKGDRTHTQLLACLQGGQGRAPLPDGHRRHYESPKYKLSIASAPDGGEGVGSVFLNKTQSACVLLLISAAGEDFEASRSLLKEQVSFACKLHLRQLVVCVNKMDATDPPYNGRRYKTIVSEISGHLWGLGRNPNYVVFLPISALRGDNMQGPSQAMPWFPGWEVIEEAGGTLRGSTLQQLLEAVIRKFRPDSCYTKGVWSQEEEKSLLLAWKALANPASSGAPCPHVLSASVMCAGVRRSPEQCRIKANFLLNRYITARLRGRLGACPFYSELLHAILTYEATQFVLQLEKLKPGLQVPAGSTSGAGRQASQASALEEDKPGTAGPSQHWESLLAGEVLGMEKGLGAHPERPQRTPEGRDFPAPPKCLGPPSGWRDQDPDCLLTGLEIKRCERLAWPPGGQREQGAEEWALSEGCRCVVYRTAYFAMKQKEAEPALGPQAGADIPEPLLAAQPPPPPEGQCPPESCPLPLYPSCPEQAPPPVSLFPYPWGPQSPLQPAISLAAPLQPVGFPCLPLSATHPMPVVMVPALEPLQFPLASPCYEPLRPARALPWQYQQAHAYTPVEPAGKSLSSQLMAEPTCDRACLGDEPSSARPSPSDTAAAASLPSLSTQAAPTAGPLTPPPTAHREPCNRPPLGSQPGPSAAAPPPPSTCHRLPNTPARDGLGRSAAALLSSLAQLSPGEAFQLLCPPGTPLPYVSPPLVAHSGMFPSPQLQCLLGSSLQSPPWP